MMSETHTFLGRKLSHHQKQMLARIAHGPVTVAGTRYPMTSERNALLALVRRGLAVEIETPEGKFGRTFDLAPTHAARPREEESAPSARDPND